MTRSRDLFKSGFGIGTTANRPAVAMPTDGKPYSWNEDSKSWDEVALASNA